MDLILCAQEIIENQTSWSSAEEQQHFYPIRIDVEKSNESNFPPTGFKKLPHTIFKMAAQACRGGADLVMHLLGKDRQMNTNNLPIFSKKKDVHQILKMFSGPNSL